MQGIATTIRRAVGRVLLGKAYDLQSLWLQGQEMPWSPGFAGSVNISAAYENSATAYGCIRRKALDVSSAPLQFFASPEEGAKEVGPSDPVRRLFDRPLPYFSREQLVQFLVTFLEMRGECFLDFDNPDAPREMSPHLDPQHFTAVKAQARLAGWRYSHETKLFTRLASEVFHHRYVSLTDPYRGQSPLRAAAKSYAIETHGDSLQASIMERGGERGILYEVDEKFTPEQRKQAEAFLLGRRPRKGEVPRDVLLPTGVKVVDPKFVEEDYQVFAAMPRSEEKICNVYGVPASLLSGKEDNYATFRGRMRIYWASTLMPLIRGLESAFDSYFGQRFGVFVRFDLSKIDALKDNLEERVRVAGLLKSQNVPWRQIEEVVGIGLDVEKLPEADDVLVNSLLYPAKKLIEEANNPAPEPVAPSPPPSTPAADAPKADLPTEAALLNRAIRQRARDPREAITRARRMAKLERDLKGGYRAFSGAWKAKVVKAVEKAGTAGASRALGSFTDGYGEALTDLFGPFHEAAAREGMTAILVITGKAEWSDRQIIVEKKVPPLSDASREWISRRRNYVKGLAQERFEELLGIVQEAVTGGMQAAEVARVVADRFDVYAGRAAMIARQEVGTAYNVSRFAEADAQGFTEGEWMTAGDELVRGSDPEDEFDHASSDGEVRPLGEQFPCGLRYPMEDGAAIGNTANCRCEWLPHVKE